MERPTGVTVLAVLSYIGCGLLVIFAICSVVFSSFIAAIMKNNPMGGTIAAGVGVVAAVVFFCIAVIAFALGWGLWNLKNWARLVTLVITGIRLLLGTYSAIFSLLHFNILALVFIIIVLGINGLIFWYLLQPDVKQAFGTTGF